MKFRYDVLLRFGSGLDHSSLRKMIVSSLPARISSKQIIWIDGIGSTVEQWMINMSEGFVIPNCFLPNYVH